MDDFLIFIFVGFLFFIITISFSRDIVDLRKERIVDSITKTNEGYTVCFYDDDVFRNSCIVVRDNTFSVGDTIKLVIKNKYEN